MTSGPNSYLGGLRSSFELRIISGVMTCAGVGGRAAHQGQQRAVGGLLAVVDRLAGADRGEHLVVLDLVHVGFLLEPR